jgi:hypothetical protein
MVTHMFDSKRRKFLQQGAAGLAAAGVSGLVLRSDAQPTREISRDGADQILIQMGAAPQEVPTKSDLKKVTPQPYGPFYRTGAPDFWRCAHFHLLAVCPGYQPLVTEIHFQGDPKRNDPMYRIENAIAVEERNVNGKTFQTGAFDIVLEPAAK